MTLPSVPILGRRLRAFQTFGANTGVGKTVLTSLLCNAAKRVYPGEHVAYLKPVSTGPGHERDDRHIERFTSGIQTKTLHQYDLPVSPHLAARVASKGPVPNQQILAECADFAASISQQGKGWLFVETAGGVHSPSPSGTTQAEMYRPLRLPVVLVGDSNLGGISLSISAFESLRARGYDVDSILMFHDAQYDNSSYLTDYFAEKFGVPVSVVAKPPARAETQAHDEKAMDEYYGDASTGDTVARLLGHLDRRHKERVADLETMASDAERVLWYPFTQHRGFTKDTIRVIDSAHDDYLHTLEHGKSEAQSVSLKPTFDGSASWWTQGLGHGNTDLTFAAAYASGRYGHVLFPGMVHAPAISLAKTLLNGLQNSRLSRVFYSDNGSTGNEVAVKMALRATRLRYGWKSDDPVGILGLKGSYHGDTIGAMDCSEPGTFNKQVEWYQGKGFWFDTPGVLCSEGKWTVNYPDGMNKYLDGKRKFTSLAEVFDVEDRIKAGEHHAYQSFIKDTLDSLQQQGHKFGALMLEPIVLGAGGMILVDPLFQRTLVDTVRQRPQLFSSHEATTHTSSPQDSGWSGLPVIFDEVFTGLYRLGRFSSASLLGAYPDISVHAKLLTGGLLPLAATIASEDIFTCFLSDEKSAALLHGHSYTAHAVGCQVALESLAQLNKLDASGQWDWAKRGSSPVGAEPTSSSADGQGVWSVWSSEFVTALSNDVDRIDGVWALGSVLAIHMHDDANSGYNSSASRTIHEALLGDDCDAEALFNVHTRVLGNVLYVMTSQTTGEDVVRRIEGMIQRALGAL